MNVWLAELLAISLGPGEEASCCKCGKALTGRVEIGDGKDYCMDCAKSSLVYIPELIERLRETEPEEPIVHGEAERIKEELANKSLAELMEMLQQLNNVTLEELMTPVIACRER